jgi:HEAT repeat protein
VTAPIIPHSSTPAPAASLAATDESNAADSPADDVEHELYVQETIAEWNAMAAQGDPRARDAVLAEMADPDREIRHAALETIIQFQDQSAIPRLHEIAATTGDPKEKAAILDAIKFMSLPSLTGAVDTQVQDTSAPATSPHGFRRFHTLLDARSPHAGAENLSPASQSPQ